MNQVINYIQSGKQDSSLVSAGNGQKYFVNVNLIILLFHEGKQQSSINAWTNTRQLQLFATEGHLRVSWKSLGSCSSYISRMCGRK